MADITKCTNYNCPLSDCKRKTKYLDPYYQSFSEFHYEIIDNKVVCEYYLVPL